MKPYNFGFYLLLNITRRYSLLRGLISSYWGGLQPLAEDSFALRANKIAFYAVCAYFRPFLVIGIYLLNFW